MNYETELGIQITDTSLFEVAFTHKSYANERPSIEHNERLEFLGDAVLELVVTEYLFHKFPEEPEGKMTKLRSSIVSGASLATTAKQLNFGDLLKLSRGEEASGGRKKNPILANVFEAVIGAIYIDSDFEVAKHYIMEHLIPRLPEILEKNLFVDPKSGFQEWAQEEFGVTPTYEIISETGPDHAKRFEVGVFVREKQMGTGIGTSKQKGEIDAARDAMEKRDG